MTARIASREKTLSELVGREAELAELIALVDEARVGRSASFVVRGDAGIGKTALLEEAARAAEGMTVVTAAGVETESELAFAGLSQLLSPLLPHLEFLPAPQATALRAALAIGPPVPSDPFAVSLGTLGLLAAAAGDDGLVVVVDDAHWLDAESLRALLFVAHRLGAEGVLLVMAVRSDAPTPIDQARIPSLRLDPLSDDASRAILERAPNPLAPAVATAVRQTATGNPLALLEIPKQLTSEQAAGHSELPDPLRGGAEISRLFERRIPDLSPEAQRVLLLVAITDANTADAIAGMLDRGPLEEAEAAGLMTLAGGIRFRHPLMRSAAYWSATDAERRSAHGTLAEMLPPTPRSLSRAWHLALASVAPDDEIAAELESGAMIAAGRGAHGAAGSALERAARLSLDPEARAERLVAAAENLELIGRFDEAFSLLDEAISETRRPDLRARAYLARGRGLTWVGSPHEAYSLLAEGATQLEPVDRGTSALLRAESANALLPAGYPGRSLAIAEEALAAAAKSGGEPLLAASAAAAQALILLGEARRAAEVIEQASSALAGADPLATAHIMLLRASFLAVLARYDESRGILEQIIAAGRGQSAPSLLPFPLAALAYIDIRTGHWTRALAEASESVDLARETGQIAFLGFSLSALAHLEAGLGRSQASHEHAAEALEIARALGADILLLHAGAARVLAAVGEGRFDEAIAAGGLVARLFEERGYREPAVLQWHGDLVEAYFRAGRADEAAQLLETLEALADATEGAWAVGVAARCRGLIGDDDAFEGQFARAIEELERARAPFERARAELYLGERRRRARRRSDARAPLRSAVETFDDLGARPWSERARAELRACGGSPSPREPVSQATEELTPHELQVALVVARGATNREAGAALFVSPKTIDFHLRNVYRKLQIRSRSQLAAMLASK